MNADALEAAARYAAARRARESAHYEAGALTSSHEDAAEVVRLWRERSIEADFMRAEIRRASPRLARALDALAEGWRS